MTVFGSASDNKGVTSVSVRVNGGAWSMATGTTTWSHMVTLASGSNTIDARSQDAAGNVSAIASRTVTYSPSGLYDASVAAAGLEGGDAQANSIPYGDGVPNLLKYAFNLNLAGPDNRTMVPGGTAGLPHVSRVPGEFPVFRIEYLRRLNAGLNYLPQTSTSLEASDWEPVQGTPQITPVDASWERVIHEIPATADRMFGRVGVELEE
jgi:hypothetical protein